MVVVGDEGVGGSFILIILFGVFDVVFIVIGLSRVFLNVCFYYFVVEYFIFLILRSFWVVISCL